MGMTSLHHKNKLFQIRSNEGDLWPQNWLKHHRRSKLILEGVFRTLLDRYEWQRNNQIWNFDCKAKKTRT